MKTILAAIVVGIMLFGISAGVSWFLIYKQLNPVVEEVEAAEESPDATDQFPTIVKESDKVESMPVALRPEIPVTVEAVSELAQSIMQKERDLMESRKRLKKDEKRIHLLFEDLRQERDELAAFGEQIDAKVMKARETVELLKIENETLAQQTKALSALEKKTGKTPDDVETDLIDVKVKKVKNWFTKLEPTKAADYLKEFANQGEIEFSARLLDSMEDRHIAKILAALNDAPLVAQIVEAYTRGDSSSKDGPKRLVR